MNAAAEYKATDWIFGGRASATYGESRTSGTDEIETSAEDAALFLRADRGFSPRVSTYALAGFEADHPKSIELRLSQELGVGYAWIDTAFGGASSCSAPTSGFASRRSTATSTPGALRRSRRLPRQRAAGSEDPLGHEARPHARVPPVDRGLTARLR